MNSNYDLIANVNINIESPIVDETSFGKRGITVYRCNHTR